MRTIKHPSRFTPEQVELLAANPFTFSVTPRHIWFTLEFKNLFLSRYDAGETSTEIFVSCGYDPDILGNNRMYNFPRRLKAQIATGRPLTEGPMQQARKPKRIDYNTMPTQQSVAAMQREITYLRQQVEFLKKITELGNDKKPRN